MTEKLDAGKVNTASRSRIHMIRCPILAVREKARHIYNKYRISRTQKAKHQKAKKVARSQSIVIYSTSFIILSVPIHRLSHESLVLASAGVHVPGWLGEVGHPHLEVLERVALRERLRWLLTPDVLLSAGGWRGAAWLSGGSGGWGGCDWVDVGVSRGGRGSSCSSDGSGLLDGSVGGGLDCCRSRGGWRGVA